MRIPLLADGRLSRRTQWCISFALFTSLLLTWAFANPLFTGPDEPDHVRRSYSVVHGELIGPTQPGNPDHLRFVKVPSRYVNIPIECFAHQPDVTANCLPSINDRDRDRGRGRGSDATVRYPLTNGRYPPTPLRSSSGPLQSASCAYSESA
jgi:hypothetical protein